MNRILTIGHNDLRVFLRDRSSFIWLFLIPLAFVYFTSFSSRPAGKPADAKATVLIVNEDHGFLSKLFLEGLGSQGLSIRNQQEKHKAKRGITIPSNFTEQILNQKEVKMDFFQIASNDGGMDLKSELVEMNLYRAILAFNGYLVEHATFSPDRTITEASLRKIIEKENPVSLDSYFAGRKPIPVGFNMSLPGIIVMYLLMNLLIFGGTSIAAERRTGVLKRIFVNPVSQTELMIGKQYGLMLLALLQIVVFLLFGQFVFKVNVGDHLLGIFVTLIIFSWVSSSLGMLIGFLVKAEDKIIGLGIMIALPVAALGGCWWPMEIVPENLQRIAHVTPSAWAMDSLHLLITFGANFSDILKPIGVLFLFGLVANTISAKFFRI